MRGKESAQCDCVTTVRLFSIVHPLCLHLLPKAVHVTALLSAWLGGGGGRAVTCLALGSVHRHKGWATQNSLAVVTCATPIQDGVD